MTSITLITPSSSPEATRFSFRHSTRLIGALQVSFTCPEGYARYALVSWVIFLLDHTSRRVYTTSNKLRRFTKDRTYYSPPPFPPIHSAPPSSSILRVLAALLLGLAVQLPLLSDVSPVSSSYRKALTSPVRSEV